jgi:hypothetical protein
MHFHALATLFSATIVEGNACHAVLDSISSIYFLTVQLMTSVVSKRIMNSMRGINILEPIML